MPSFRFLALAAVAAALVVVAPAIGDSGASARSVPPAGVAGGDIPPPLPSLVNTRLVRAQAALGRATDDFDENQAAQAVVPIGSAVDNLTKAWSAEKYLIQNAPPPPVDDAIADGDPVVGAYAGPEDTAFALFGAQHDLVSTSVGMIETTNAALQARLISAISSVQNTRVTAIRFIAALVPPPEDDAAIDGPEGESTWATVMPTTVGFLDDEIQQINGRLAMNNFPAAVDNALNAALGRAQNAKALVNQYWPGEGQED